MASSRYRPAKLKFGLLGATKYGKKVHTGGYGTPSPTR